MAEYDALVLRILSALTGELLPETSWSDPAKIEERIALAACATSGMTAERWDGLSKRQRMPWLAATLKDLENRPVPNVWAEGDDLPAHEPVSVKKRLLDAVRVEHLVLQGLSQTPAKEVDWTAGIKELWELWRREFMEEVAPPPRPNAKSYAEARDGLDMFRRAVESLDDPSADSTAKPSEARPADSTATVAEQYVTLDQMAALINRSKKTLERKMNASNSDMPAPDVEGGGGRPHEWKWTAIRPWLEKQFKRQIPERFPR